MSFKTFTQIIVLTAILLASFASPGNAQASSSCGSTYVVQWGDSLSVIAQRCGTTLAALYAANPGLGYYLYAGQALVIPGSGYSSSPSNSYANTYTVQRGDTFAMIAKRFGVSVNELWSANGHIWDINRIYPGQVIYVPGSSETLVERSYGVAPSGTPSGNIKLINNANAEVYVSLQGTTKDGVKVINEYPVSGSMNVSVPIGWYSYVAWVGGQQFVGEFTLRKTSHTSIKFYIDKVVVGQ